MNPRTSLGLPGALLSNGLALAVLGGFLLLARGDPDLYYQSVQEDEALEWATFWAFLLAAVVSGRAAVRERRTHGILPWFRLGVALFCTVVALEEISWGQRVLGYRPPAYFLEHNYQQELNVHNVMSRPLRVLAVKAVMLGYGVALPLAARLPLGARGLGRLAVPAPPLALAPIFLMAFVTYQRYPVKFAGEIVELVLGLAFLFAAWAPSAPRGPAEAGRNRRLAASLVLASLGVAALGFASAAGSRWQRNASPHALEAARQELQALRRDFLAEAAARGGRLPTRCGLHKRLYTYRRDYRQAFLDSGRFVALAAQGLAEERAAFFLDPWNSPYWIRDHCEPGASGRVVFLYSFGPNRRRDSARDAPAGDDVGVVLADTRRAGSE